jgi:hypothetical protein
MIFKLYKLLWKVTSNRYWLIKCINILNEEAIRDYVEVHNGR